MNVTVKKRVRELMEGWRLSYGLTNSSATRVFIDDTTQSEIAMPWIGDDFPQDDAVEGRKNIKLYVESVDVSKYGLPNRNKYVINYSTRQPGGSGDSPDMEDPDKMVSRSYQLGGEIITIKGGDAGYKWLSDSLALNQNIALKVAVGSLTVERRSSRDVFPVNLLRKSYIGRVNTLEFEGCDPATVLLEGVAGTEYRNDAGKKRYKITMSFRYRANSWQKILRQDKDGGSWDTPYLGTLPTVLYMFETADLNDLLKPEFF